MGNTFQQRYLHRLKASATTSAIPRIDASHPQTQQQPTVARGERSSTAHLPENTKSPQNSPTLRNEVIRAADTENTSSSASKKRKRKNTPSKVSSGAAAAPGSIARQATISHDDSMGGGNAYPSPSTVSLRLKRNSGANPSLDDTDPEITDAQYENVEALMLVFCKVPFLGEFSRSAMLLHPERMTLYSKIISNPIDLGYICQTIRRRAYNSVCAIQSDVWRVFSNSIKFHTAVMGPSSSSSVITISMAMHLRDYFDSLWQEYMIPSDAPPRLPGKGVSHVHSMFQERADWRKERLTMTESTVLTAKFLSKLATAFESFLSSGGKVDNLDKDAILGDNTSATNDIITFVRSIRRIIHKIDVEIQNGQGYTVLDLYRDVKRCSTDEVSAHDVLTNMKISQRLDRILGKALAPVCEMSCRGVNRSRIWGWMAAIVWARESKKKPYWPAIVLGILAPDDLKEDWHRSLTDRNEARLPEQLREKLRAAKIQAEQELKKNQRSYFLVEFMGSHAFIWVREDNIIESFDPNDNINATHAARNTAYNAIHMSNAIEEGRLTRDEFELSVNDACADGFETDDKHADSIFTFETLCQSGDEIDDMNANSKKAKLNELCDSDGLLGLSIEGTRKKHDLEIDCATKKDRKKALKSKAKASQKCGTAIARQVVAAAPKTLDGNYSRTWSTLKALVMMNSSSDSDNDGYQENAEKPPSLPILQDESQGVSSLQSALRKMNFMNRHDGQYDSLTGSLTNRYSAKKSPSSASSSAAAAVATAINSAISIVRTQRLRTTNISPKQNMINCNGLYSPIKYPPTVTNGCIAATSSTSSTSNSNASPRKFESAASRVDRSETSSTMKSSSTPCNHSTFAQHNNINIGPINTSEVFSTWSKSKRKRMRKKEAKRLIAESVGGDDRGNSITNETNLSSKQSPSDNDTHQKKEAESSLLKPFKNSVITDKHNQRLTSLLKSPPALTLSDSNPSFDTGNRGSSPQKRAACIAPNTPASKRGDDYLVLKSTAKQSCQQFVAETTTTKKKTTKNMMEKNEKVENSNAISRANTDGAKLKIDSPCTRMDNHSTVCNVMPIDDITSVAIAADAVKKNTNPFLDRLHDVVSSESDTTSCIHWDISGSHFTISDRSMFKKKVLPCYFDNILFQSFTRRLERLGFTRTRGDRVSDTFFHPTFTRDLHPTTTTAAATTATTETAVSMAAATNGLKPTASSQAVVDLTFDSSDDESTESSSSQDRTNHHTTLRQQNYYYAHNELQNGMSNRMTMNETLPIDRVHPNTTTISSNKQIHLSPQDPRRTTADQPEARVATEKPALISCSLTGILSATTRKNGNCCHAIRGTWINTEFPTSIALKFVLRREVSPGDKSIPLMTDGDFHGTFTCRVPDQKGYVKDIHIEERNVTILFMKCQSEVHSYTLNGAGENQFGKFDLAGKARKLDGSDNYHLEFRKSYTALAQSVRADIANPTSSSSRKKMRLSSEVSLAGIPGLSCRTECNRSVSESIIAALSPTKTPCTRDEATGLWRTASAAVAVASPTHDAVAATHIQQPRKSTTSNHDGVINLLFDSSDDEDIELIRLHERSNRHITRQQHNDDELCIASQKEESGTALITDTMHVGRSVLPELKRLNGSNCEDMEDFRKKLCFDVSRAVQKATVGRGSSMMISENLSSNDVFKNDVLGTLQVLFRTPIGYDFFKFVISQQITSDEKLASANPEGYIDYLRTLNVPRRICQEACRVQCLSSSANGIQWKTRIDQDSDEEVMNNVPNLCKDELVDGLPMRTIYTIGPSFDIVYEFVISIKQSTCCTDAGNGAFLTFKGAKTIKESSKWKQAAYEENAAETRGTKEALLPHSRFIVSITGRDIHDDDRVDFTAEDFIEIQDNITFSSKHIGCGLIELESRYGPLLPTDRKTDLVFHVKDFLFSHEPSAWRFDVDGTLNKETSAPNDSSTRYKPRRRAQQNSPNVIDFTDDATGAPHEVAESHVSMYVNEVGHNEDLVENVEAVNNKEGSVVYYINIDEPLKKGDTVELLVNYKEAYETMRVRRGYGRDNILNGVKGDDDDITRVQRNVQERFETENTIETFELQDVVEVVYFLKDRVWDGLKAATSKFAFGRSEAIQNLSRQCIARRRMDWITQLLSNRLKVLLEDWSAVQYIEGMIIFVHAWPQNCLRPPYTGLAMIDSIAEDEHKKTIFRVTTSDNKCIYHVPEGVVSFPTADDMASASERDRAKWKKWKVEQEIPRILDCLETFRWDQSFANSIYDAFQTYGIRDKIVNSLRWEFVEEVLFLLEKNDRISAKFVVSRRCPLSATFVSNCLLLFADFFLLNKDNKDLFRNLMDLVRDTQYELQETIERVGTSTDLDLSLVGKLTFDLGPNDDGAAQRRLVVEQNYEMSFDQFVTNPTQFLDYVWYAIYQIALPLHKIASLFDWGTLYSVELLCKELSISLSSDERSKFKDWDPLL